MATTKVSQLAAKTSPSGSEELLINDGGTSKKITIANLPDTNTTYSVGDGGLTEINFTSADNTKLDGIEASATADQTDAEIRAAVEAATDSNVFTDADHSKLDGIEASADVTDTANVTAAGALMDSEVTNLSQVKAFDSSDYATAAQGTTADAALPKTGGAMTGAITTNSTFDGVDVGARDAVLTSTTTTANAALPKAGGAMTGNVTHADNVRAQFGAGNDLEIYHDGTDSIFTIQVVVI